MALRLIYFAELWRYKDVFSVFYGVALKKSLPLYSEKVTQMTFLWNTVR